MIKGNDIIISLDGTPLVNIKSDDIKSDIELIEVASSTTGAYREYISSRKNWSFSSNYLVFSDSDILALLYAGTSYTVTIKKRGESPVLQGTAILTSCQITATRGNLAQGSFSFQGSGALVEVE